ncbi:tetratricopeptide repeat protein [Thalassotalea castellviae]|uniref:DUF560 domain-containing protein n=1 Tax=Thalassotalea castellviae TaxID=3075612 RepID=A0ABU2ZX12_9GAMM|nr:hypothetical protein [Thalassotalea sp. W431]MDT0602468.1 hypothetical protein [Thalassotalea sp. W431]
MNKLYYKNNRSWLVLFLLLSLDSNFVMANATSPEKILSLLKSQQSAQAFQLATEAASEHEGDPQFDLAFALAARAVGEFNQAVYAFERVLFVKPNSIDARLGLAISYYDLKNFQGAKTEFSLLSKQQLTAKLLTIVNQYLAAIEKRTGESNGHWRHWLRAGFGTDSNANNGSSDEFITLPLLGQIRLFENSREISSSFYNIQGQTLYVKPIDQLAKWYASASILHVEFSEQSAFSKSFASLFAGYQTRIKNYEINASLFYRPLWLDSEDFLNYYGGKIGVNQIIWQDSRLGVDYSHAFEDYNQETLLNKQQSLIEAWLEQPFYNGTHRFTARFGKENAKQSVNDFSSRDFWGVGYSLKQTLTPLWHYKASIDYLTGEYNAPDKVFNIVRDDSFFRAELELGYQYNTQWRLFSKLSYLNNNSNLSLYEFSRYKFWIGGQYDF